MTFTLHPKLDNGSSLVYETDLYQVRLKDDQRFLWLQLIPKRENVEELFDLPFTEASSLFAEIYRLSALLKKLTAADRINVAWLGNVVSQFHIHIVVRTHNDACWPNPIWGQGAPVPYEDFQATLVGLQKILFSS